MEKEKSSFRYIAVMYILLICITVPLFFILLPRIRRNMDESGFAVNYTLWKEQKKNGRKADYTVVLSSPDGFVRTQRKAESLDSLHAVLEAVLLPLSEAEKANGYTSYIPQGTSLVGVTEEDRFFFVELSPDFLSTGNIKGASDQIKKTLEEYWPLESLTIISGNTVIKL